MLNWDSFSPFIPQKCDFSLKSGARPLPKLLKKTSPKSRSYLTMLKGYSDFVCVLLFFATRNKWSDINSKRKTLLSVPSLKELVEMEWGGGCFSPSNYHYLRETIIRKITLEMPFTVKSILMGINFRYFLKKKSAFL